MRSASVSVVLGDFLAISLGRTNDAVDICCKQKESSSKWGIFLMSGKMDSVMQVRKMSAVYCQSIPVVLMTNILQSLSVM